MTIISVYKFKNPQAADDALEALWRRLCGGFERSAGGEIWITSFCDDAYLAGQICQSLGGAAK